MKSFLKKNLNLFLFFISFPCFPLLYTLDNGMTIILEERHTTEFIAIQAFVKAGSIFEDKYAGTGISHLVEHMLFKGTKKRNAKEIIESIEKNGGEMNASTSFDKTVYKIIIPSSKAYIALDILKDILFFSEFPQEELVKEKEVILKEITTRDNEPDNFLITSLLSSAFTTHPMKYPIIGYRELFKTLERNDLINYYQERYIPSNIVLSICGNFNEKELFEKIKRVFGSIERKKEKSFSIPNEPPQVSKREFYKERPLSLSYLAIGFHIPPIFNPDFYSLDILSVILGQGRASRLYGSLIEEKNLVSSIDSWILGGNFPSLFGILATMPHPNLKEVRDEILKELERIKNDGISQKELIFAKRKIIADIYKKEETIEDRAYTLGISFLATGSPYFMDDYIKRIEKIKPGEIRNVAKAYLTTSNMTIGILSEIPLEEESKEVISKKRVIKKGVLKNGIIYLIGSQKTKGLVSIYALFKGGRLVEHEGKEGISNLTSSLLLKGTKNKEKKEIIDTIESLGGSISTYSGRNSFGISIFCLPSDIKKCLLLLKEILTEPAFPPSEIEKEKKRIILSIEKRKDDIFLSCFDLFLKTLYTIHPYRIPELGTIDSIRSITRNDIILFYKDRIMPNNMVLTIFGNVDIKETEKNIENIFKGWKKGELYRAKPYFEPELTEDRKLMINEKRFIQAGIMIGFPGVKITDEERYIFELISSILSRQGGRLFNSLREEEGLTYYNTSFNVFGIDPGCFIIYAQTSKENIERVYEKIEREIIRLKDEEISIDELNDTKSYLIGKKEKEEEENASYGFEIGLNELYGIPFKKVEEYKERIKKITPSEIKKIVEKYFTKKIVVIFSP